MRKFFIICIFIFSILNAKTQNLLDLKNWKFSTGDDPSWTRSEVDDSKWINAQVGEVWEHWGFPKYDGFAWYRKKVVIPSSMKNEAKKQDGFMLKLARIDDVDFTYFNGALVGQTGDVPPHLVTKYDVIREYTIPFNLILWDQPNTIAVRVFDADGYGGIYGTDISLQVKNASDVLNITPVFKESDRILKGNPDVKLTIEIQNNASQKIHGKVRFVILTDSRDTINVKDFSVKMEADSKTMISHQLKGLKPGIYSVSASILSEEQGSKAIKYNFGYEPEKMTTESDTPIDMVDFWNRAKHELEAVNPQYKLTKIDSLCKSKVDCYLVEMRSLGNVLVRGWLVSPKKRGKYPAILSVQGYSSNLKPNYNFQDDNVVSLSLNIRGHGNSKDNVNPGFPGYLLYQIEDKEQYIYRGAYMDCVRAVDFLYSFADVDTARVAVEGGSQGGALTFATAALCGNRIKAAVPHVPFLSDFPEYLKVAKWPTSEWSLYAENHPEFGLKGILGTLRYFDIKNLAPWITAPVFMGVGLVDVTCPPRINFAAYNNLKVEKRYLVFPESGHGLPKEFGAIRKQYLIEKLRIKNEK